MKESAGRFVALAAALLLVVPGCGGSAQEGKQGGAKDQDPVLAFIAASTKDAVQEIGARFTREHGIAVKVNADDSSKLATQIVEEAPGHLFLSANEKWADFLKEKGYVQEMKPLLGNTLVLVVPRGNPARVTGPRDLTGAEVRRVALAGPNVPAGIYARQALQKLRLWDALEKGRRVVSGENVRVTLAYVERGEVEAGIVYSTDARITKQVEQVHAFDPSTHDPIRYPLVLLQRGAGHAGARKFYDYLRSPGAGEVFRKYGFSVLEQK